jgi:hypothetical protein
MNLFQQHPGELPPALRALALGLLVETVVPLINKALEEESTVLPGQGEGSASNETELWQTLRHKCGELSTLVLRADDPEEAASYVIGYLPKHIDYVFELVRGRTRSLSTCELKAGCRFVQQDRWHVIDPA